MTTEIAGVTPETQEEAVLKAVGILRDGGLVAFPTETVYGLGADAMNADAVRRVFEAKGRPSDNPLIVHLESVQQMEQCALDIPPQAYLLAAEFWPGPMTLVLRSKEIVPPIVRGALPTVALRVPDHPVPRALVRMLGRGIVGPSANTSGRPSPTTAHHVLEDLGGKIELILDAGATAIGVESTVIDLTTARPLLLRLGGLSREDIEDVVGEVESTVPEDLLRHSPGTRHRHYAPHAAVVLIPEMSVTEFLRVTAEASARGKKISALLHSPTLSSIPFQGSLEVLPTDLNAYARGLFAALRKLDSYGAELIVVESVPEVGVGRAVMDRLRRAAQIQ